MSAWKDDGLLWLAVEECGPAYSPSSAVRTLPSVTAAASTPGVVAGPGCSAVRGESVVTVMLTDSSLVVVTIVSMFAEVTRLLPLPPVTVVVLTRLVAPLSGSVVSASASSYADGVDTVGFISCICINISKQLCMINYNYVTFDHGSLLTMVTYWLVIPLVAEDKVPGAPLVHRW